MKQHLHSNITRRRFLKATAATWATVSIAPRHVIGGPGQTPPSARINLAGVGIGGIGFGQLKSCAQVGFNIVALCDVDDVYAKKAFDEWPQARRYRDYREMLQAEGDKIDAVYCGTPDHTHAVVVMAALQRRKHVCCVKPLTRTMKECDMVVDAARKAGVATQVTATPNTSGPACRTCELIWAGAIGAVREVAATLRHIRSKPIDRAELNSMSDLEKLSHEEHIRLEQDRIARCIAYLKRIQSPKR